MITTDSKDRASNQIVAKPKSTYSNRLADGIAIFTVVVGAALIIPAVGFLMLGLAAMTVASAATFMLSISISAVLAIYPSPLKVLEIISEMDYKYGHEISSAQ